MREWILANQRQDRFCLGAWGRGAQIFVTTGAGELTEKIPNFLMKSTRILFKIVRDFSTILRFLSVNVCVNYSHYDLWT